ncbi:RNA polymerase sigma factor [Aquibacillus saliphilus]|uniref:RNA polymerase sigma factor n=1 Tax=Aquibacillus saliphilus TaxID=1909422 RepID=UPI001CEFB5AE|nr:RNA polymerase sigma factor [Aquibacillus saliphilus]
MFEHVGQRKRNNEKVENEKLIFEMFYKRVYNSAYFIVQDKYIAQDIVQETFLKAFQRMDTIKDVDKLGAWLGTIATRTAIDFLRKLKVNTIPIEDKHLNRNLANENSNYHLIEEEIEYKELKRLLHNSIVKLKPKYREALLLKYEYDFSDKQIAETLNLTISATKSRLHRGKSKLREILLDSKAFKDGDIL